VKNKIFYSVIIPVMVIACEAENRRVYEDISGLYRFTRSAVEYDCDSAQNIVDNAINSEYLINQFGEGVEMYDQQRTVAPHIGNRSGDRVSVERHTIAIFSELALSSSYQLKFTDNGFSGVDYRTITINGSSCTGQGAINGELISRFLRT